ncbi:MAG: hypothetical protein ACOYOE_13425 [Chlorobium sp.]
MMKAVVTLKSGVAPLRRRTALPQINPLSELRKINEMKIRDFAKLLPGWDGYGALPIPGVVITRALAVISKLKEQPLYVFPSARETIQFEYDIADASLEIEIGEKSVEFLSVEGNFTDEWVSSDINDLFRVIDEFHAKAKIL